MAGNLSDTAETLVLKWLFSDQTASRPTGWFLALYTTTPSDAGGGTEISTSGTGYGRQAVTFGTSGNSLAADTTFGPATSDWGTVVAVGVFDDTNRFIAWGPVTTPTSIPNLDSAKFAAGSITISAD